jgi:hypothetical protein
MLRARMGILLSSLVLCLTVLPVAGASASTTGPCNEETATALGEEYDLNPFAPITKAMSPLCGEFLGPGVEAMVARAIPATCGGYAGWAAFRHEADSSWQLVWKERNGQWDLKAVGNDLEETDKILGPHEPRCGEARTTKTRIWHWNGQAFVYGPWMVHLLGTAPTFLRRVGQRSVQCTMGDTPGGRHNGVSCNSTVYAKGRYYRQRADLRPSGQVKVCRKHSPRGCEGIFCGCSDDFPELFPGELVVIGRFTCQISKHGVRCTNNIGKGFVITPKKIRRLQ